MLVVEDVENEMFADRTQFLDKGTLTCFFQFIDDENNLKEKNMTVDNGVHLSR